MELPTGVCIKTLFEADFNPAAISIPGNPHLFYQERNWICVELATDRLFYTGQRRALHFLVNKWKWTVFTVNVVKTTYKSIVRGIQGYDYGSKNPWNVLVYSILIS